MRMNNQAQRSHNITTFHCPGCFPASQLQSSGNMGMLRPLSSFPTCLHSSSSTAWDWTPPSRKTFIVLTSAVSSPAHSKRYKKPNQTNKFTAVFEALKLSPDITSLKNSTKSLFSLNGQCEPTKASCESTSIPIRFNGYPKLPEKASLDPYFSLSPTITFQMFLLFLHKEGIFLGKNFKTELFLD